MRGEIYMNKKTVIICCIEEELQALVKQLKNIFCFLAKFKLFLRVSQKFCNILVPAILWQVYHMIEAVQAIQRHSLSLVVL